MKWIFFPDKNCSKCDENALCVNNDFGKKICKCVTGFAGDGENCADVDECEDLESPCDENYSCKNTIGSFSCHCSTGFKVGV